MDPRSSQYKTIWNAEDADHEEYMSETDVESGHEKQWHCEEEIPARKWDEPCGIVSTIKAYCWIMNTCLLLVVIGLLTILLLREPSGRQLGTDFTASNHRFSTSVMKWNADERFVPYTQAEWYSDSTTEQWNTLMPAGTSPPGGPNGTKFATTSMTHSLHCLFMMGRMYSALQDGC